MTIDFSSALSLVVFQKAEGGRPSMRNLLSVIGSDEGQDIAEYAVMLAVILVLVIGTIRLVGSNANNAFSAVASSIQ
jgi:Flp pilus assembly pilin Flp